MILLITYAFLAGIVTILSPCILPLLPIILTNSLHPTSKKPMGIVLGFVASFTFFTLFLSQIVRSFGVSADALRHIAILVLIIFAVSLLFDKITQKIELWTSSLLGRLPRAQNKETFASGILIGFSLGLLWTPCVGPILASIITLSLTGAVTSDAFFITFAYSLGTSLPMLLVMKTGGKIFQKLPLLRANLPKIQKVFALIMLLTALALYFGFDRSFQSFVLDKFPSYGANLTSFESNDSVKKALNDLDQNSYTQQENLSADDSGKFFPLSPELILGGDWINSEPLQLKKLRGKVVLIDFWTYTCINCIRTLPYLKSWHEKYSKDGLVIIGVHSPEFEFEKSLKNVQQAVTDFDIKYPIMQDNDFATWKAYQNQYWPAKYLIDHTGKIRYTHFGEGEYNSTERKIQELLSESGKSVETNIDNPDYRINARTPEIYLGSARADHYDSLLGLPSGKQSFATKSETSQNTFALSGKWEVGEERSRSLSSDSTLLLSFEASQVHIVLSSPTGNKKIKVYLDGKLVNNETAGIDVKNGEIEVTDDRKYEIIKLPQAGKHLLRLEFSPDIDAYAFTFG